MTGIPGVAVILLITLLAVQSQITRTGAPKKKKFEDVVTHGLCAKNTCRRANDIITCCYLSALKELGKVIDGDTVDLPKSLRLHIVKIKSKSLCTDVKTINGAASLAGLFTQNNKCNSTKLSASKNTLFKRVAGLTITKTSLEYISEDFFNLFPKLKHLVIENNPSLKEIPAINRLPKSNLQTISYIGNTKVQMVRWIESSPFPVLREFLFSNFLEKADDPITDFYMGSFTPGKKFKAFKIRLNYQNSHITMPAMDQDSKLSQLYIGSTNIPENLRLNYTNFKGKVKTVIFNFPTKPDKIVPDFLPKDFESRFSKASMRFDGESYDLKNLEFQRKVPKERVIVTTQNDEEALMEVRREYGAPKSKIDSKGRYIFKYFILDTNDLVKLVKDSHNLDKRYIVKTHYLWVRDTAFLRKSVKLHLIFNSLILTPGAMLWSADLKQAKRNQLIKNKDFSVAQSITLLWRQFDLKEFYEYLTIAASLSEAIHYGDNRNYTHDIMKMKMAATMIEAASEKDVATSVSLSFLPSSQISFVEEALTIIPKLYEFSRRDLQSRTQMVTTLDSGFNEKSMLYQEIAKTLIISEKYETKKKRLFVGIKLLSDTSIMRVDTLKENLKVDMTRWLEEEKESWFLLEKIRNIRQKYSDDLEPIKTHFVDKLKTFDGQSKYRDLVSPIQELFEKLFFQQSNKHNMTGRSYISRSKLMNSVEQSIKDVSKFILDLENIQNRIGEIYATTTKPKETTIDDAKIPVSDSSAYFRKRLSEISNSKTINNNRVMKVLSEFSGVKPGNVFKYDLIMQKFDKLLDSELSREIGETLAFKTSLLRLLDVAKVESEILYDVTKAQVNIFIGNYTLNSFDRQKKILSKRSNKIIGKKAGNSNDEDEDPSEEFINIRQSMIYQLKLDMLLHVQQYCSFYEYNIQTNCLLKKQFSSDASLPNILHLTNKLLMVSDNQYFGERIAPQSFSNVPIKYEYNEQCKEIVQAARNEFIAPDSSHLPIIIPPPTINDYQPSPLPPQMPVIKNDLPTKPSNDLPAPPSNNLPAPPSNNLPAPPSNNFPVPPSNDLPAPPSNDLPAPPSNNLPAKPSNDLPAPPSNDLPVPSSNDLPTPSSASDVAKPTPAVTRRLKRLKKKPTPQMSVIKNIFSTQPSSVEATQPAVTRRQKTSRRKHHHHRRHHHKLTTTTTTTTEGLKNTTTKPTAIKTSLAKTHLTTKTAKTSKLMSQSNKNRNPTKAIKMSNIRQPVPFMELIDTNDDDDKAMDSTTAINSNDTVISSPDSGSTKDSFAVINSNATVIASPDNENIREDGKTDTTVSSLSGIQDVREKPNSNTTITASFDENTAENQTKPSNSFENTNSSTPITMNNVNNKKSDIIDDSLAYDDTSSAEGADDEKLSPANDEKKKSNVDSEEVETETDDLLAGWIDEKLGLSNTHHTANASKRNHLGHKPIRTLDGHRVRRTTINPEKESNENELETKIESLAKQIMPKTSSDWVTKTTGEAVIIESKTNKLENKMKRDLTYTKSSREHFESMYRKCNASKIFEIRQNSLATLTISTNNKQFRGFERIRVNEIKVFLHGIKTDNGFVQVKIRSGSFMHDKINNKKQNFVAQRWEKDFRYNLDDMKTVEPTKKFPAKIEADSYHNRNSMDFHPTPFTTWIISVSNELNPGLDLSGLTSIEMLFSGSLIPSPTTEIQRQKNFFDRIGHHSKNSSTTSTILQQEKQKQQQQQQVVSSDEIDPTKKMKITKRRQKNNFKSKRQKKKLHKSNHDKVKILNTSLNFIQSHINKFSRVVFNSTGDGFTNRPTKQLERIENEKKKPFITWDG